MEGIKGFLQSIKVSTEGNRLLEKLSELGVESVEDLKDIEPGDLVETGQPENKYSACRQVVESQYKAHY